jgi:hypothetical protein
MLISLLILIGCDQKEDPTDKLSYEVIFMDGDTIILSIEVFEGEDATPPVDPRKEGYEFIGWDKSLTNIQTNQIIYAQFKEVKISYNVIFMDGDTIILSTKVFKGEDVLPPVEFCKEGYEFIGWDKSLTNIQTNQIIYAQFKEVKISYDVIFMDGDTIILSNKVLKGEGATPPVEPRKEGYDFMGWDKPFTNVQRNLMINAIYKKKPPMVNDRINYVSYKDSFTYEVINSPSQLIKNIDQNSLLFTIENIFVGGFRGQDQTHYYDSNESFRNAYGFEIAVSNDGIVINKGTLVTVSKGGFVLSGHSKTADELANINVGDIVVYDKNLKNAKVYRDGSKSKVIGLFVHINRLINNVENANSSYLALKYQLIESKLNEAILLFNDLLVTFDSSKFVIVEGLLLDVDFLLVEVNPVETKAYWHYPLKNTNFPEENLVDVQNLLDKVKEMGFNKIYLNTNFNGKSIYKSNYLQQTLANTKVYGNYKDYLECFIDEAHKRDIAVSAWTNTLILGDGSFNSTYSKSWSLISYEGLNNHNGMYFLDISNLDVQTFLVNIMTELATNYNLDGIEYDFIRYPSGNLHSYTGVIGESTKPLDWGYTDSFINTFKLVNPFTGDIKTHIRNSQTFRTKWLDFKRQVLTDTVEKLSSAIKNTRPGISVSAAVMSSINIAKKTYLQDWQEWINKGWVDTLEPMIYSGDPNTVLSSLENMYEVVDGKAEIVVGLHPEGSMSLPGVNAEEIGIVTSNYPVGWSKFSSKVIFKSEALMHGFSQLDREYTVTPRASNKDIFNSYVYDLLDKVENYYQYRDDNRTYIDLINLLKDNFYNHDLSNEDYLNILNLIETNIKSINNEFINTKLLKKLTYVKSLF